MNERASNDVKISEFLSFTIIVEDLFDLSLAELQLFTLQLITHKPVTCLLIFNCGVLVISWTELSCRELDSGSY
jgi:hypothetical protein